MIEEVVEDRAVGVEPLVLYGEADVLGAADCRQHVVRRQSLLEILDHQVEPGQPVDHVEAGDVHRVIVVPDRRLGPGLVERAVAGRVVQTRADVRIEVVARFARKHVEVRVAVGMRRQVPPVLVDRRLHVVIDEDVVLRQMVLVPHHGRLAVADDERRPRGAAGARTPVGVAIGPDRGLHTGDDLLERLLGDELVFLLVPTAGKPVPVVTVQGTVAAVVLGSDPVGDVVEVSPRVLGQTGQPSRGGGQRKLLGHFRDEQLSLEGLSTRVVDRPGR